MTSITPAPTLLDPYLLCIAALAWRGAPDAAERDEGPEQWGSYTGVPPNIRLERDGRIATLLAPMSYRRPDKSDWPVPIGSKLDGASIPRPFWSIIGGPFEGRYRDASIVHDHYCDLRTRRWQDTHRMFYEAMRCSGTPAAQAKIMYYAVYRFGPRWELGAEAVEWSAPGMPGPVATEGPVLVADAEAIQKHDLDLAEIETLGDYRNAQTTALEGGEESPGMVAAGIDRARLIVIPGGSGTPEDVAAVLRSATRLSSRVVDRFLAKGVRVIACRGSITDFERSLRGAVPRGWEGLGKTWDNVPGVYLDNRHRVVIATTDHHGARAVALASEGSHGSADLVLHESLHGYDYSGGHAVLAEPDFLAARASDLPKLGAYERQAGQAGLEETYAESGARFIAEPAALKASWPGLFGYWSQEGPEAPDVTIEGTAAPPEETSLGTAELGDDGRIHLNLRAVSDGAIGHAALTLSPGDAAYGRFAGLVGAELAGEGGNGPVLLPASID